LLKSVGRYILEERIGEGAMADVYRGHDPQISRKLAIKLLKRDYVEDSEYASRFMQEARAAGALSHPGIVTIYDVGEADGQPYIAMELLDGQPLDAVMLEHKKLPQQQVMAFAVQLAQALDYAHQQGVVHRDIKPSNIVVSRDRTQVKLLDFGIARIGPNVDPARDPALGRFGAAPGTPRYMSPEQAIGQPLDGRSDLFSLGVVLYELLTGRKCFSASSMASLMVQITQSEPEPLAKIAPDVSNGLQFIIGKLLAKRPERRFQTGADLAAAISSESEALDALSQESRKHRYLPMPVKVTLLMSAIIALVLALAIFVVLDRQGRAMRDLAVTQGSALAGFIGKNSGTYMALEDWASISVFVKVSSEDPNVDDMMVIDNSGIIRGAKNERLEGKRWNGKPLAGQQHGRDTQVDELRGVRGDRVFRFIRPVAYAGKSFGHVVLSLRQDRLDNAAKVSRLLLLALAIITLLSVVIVAYAVASSLAAPMRRIRIAMDDMARGNSNVRITHSRRDEFGETFDAYNQMADSVQERIDSALGFGDPKRTGM
jgi:eukaryotic-like serine/threonine-protein kinase